MVNLRNFSAIKYFKGRSLLLKLNIKNKKIMDKLNTLDWTVLVLVVVGGLNWALVGLFDFDLVAAIFGDMSVLSRIVYILVGLSAVYVLALFGKLAKK